MSQRSPAVARAAEVLYGASLRGFVEDRKRLAAEARQAGDRPAAAVIARLPRPSMSAWVVNQLHRQAGAELEALFQAGARLREGDFSATGAQRAALARLRQRAAEILRGDGHAASDGTLGRVQTTLQALAAVGSFAPDPPGELVADRDPPGFDVLAGANLTAPPAGRDDGRARPAEDQAEREREREAARRAAEVRRLEQAADRARDEADALADEVARLRAELARAEAACEDAHGPTDAAEAELREARAR
jgi:hypothetical protein